MRKLRTMGLILGAILSQIPLLAQVNCATPQGILALMMAGATTGTPQDVDDIGGSILKCTAQSRLFAAAQTGTNTACANRVKMHIYYTTVQGALSTLPNISTTSNWAIPANVKKVTATFTFNSSTPNVYSCSGTIPRTGLTQGQSVYYRWAKEIEKDNDVDPWVWGSVLTFVVTATTPPPPPPAQNPNLKPLNALDVPLYKKQGGSFGDGLDVFMGVVTSFCDNIETAGQLAGNLQGSYADKRIFKRTIQLPPITWGVQNTVTNLNVNNNFTCQLFKNGTNTPVQTFSVQNMAGNDQMVTTFTNRGSVEVFYFPGPNPGLCFAKTISSSSTNIANEESQYKVVVDSGGNVTETNESSSDNSKTYSQ